MKIDANSITKLFELVKNHGMEFLGFLTIGIATAFGLIKFFSQKIFDNYLQKSFEKYKSELERENTKHRIQFENLQKQRAEFIKRLYGLIHSYSSNVLWFFNDDLEVGIEDKHLKFLLDSWENSMMEYSKVFNENRILLSEKLCSRLDYFGESLSGIYRKTETILYKHPSIKEQILSMKDKNSDYSKLKNDVNQLFNIELIQVQKDLEANFRSILGVI